MNIIEYSRYDEPGPDKYAEIMGREYERENTEDSGYLVDHGRYLLEQIVIPTEKRPESVIVDKSLINEPDIIAVLERCGDIPIYVTDLQVTGIREDVFPWPNVYALFRKPELKSPEELCRDARRICVMERTVAPNDICISIRSAMALGMDALLVAHDCGSLWTRRGVRAGRTSLFRDTWTKMPPVDDLIGYLHGLGFKTAYLSQDPDSMTLKASSLQPEERLAIIIGDGPDEQNPDTEAKSDYRFHIPANPGEAPVELTTAATLAFYELGIVE